MPRGFDGNAARDLYSGSTGGNVTITDASGRSIIGQPINNSTMWQEWNITFTSDSGTTSTMRAYPRSVSHNVSTTASASTDITWEAWSGDYGTTTLTGSVTDNVIQLHQATTTTSIDTFGTSGVISASNVVWTEWATQFPNDRVRRAPDVFVRMSREERERWEQREIEVAAQRAEERARYEEQLAEERAKREAAENKAEQLLLRHLTPEQQAEYKKSKRFYLYTGGKKYRIDKGWQGNVKLVDESDQDKVLASYCIHPTRRIPEQDNMLAQKLLLEGSEAEFKRIANESRYG